MASSKASKVSFWDEETEEDKQNISDWITTKKDTEETPSRVFSPDTEHCGLWDSSPNKKRHASFGNEGTTASATCHGHLSQISQFLGAGHSGVFAIDKFSTSQPCYVARRAQDLESCYADPQNNTSFGILLPYDLSPDEERPLDVKWVHWRWPRYEYDTRVPHVKASFQYMVHDGVVLQQFTLENNSNETVKIDELQVDLGFSRIRDLDFVDDDYPFNYSKDNVFELAAPSGYGYVRVHALYEQGHNQGAKSPAQTDQPSKSPHAVASVTTIYMNGKAAKTPDGTWLGPEELKGKNVASGRNTLEIVIAYKLMLLQKSKSNWRNFVVSAKDANINHWLRKEREELWEENNNTLPPVAGLSMISIQESKTEVTQGRKQDAASPTSNGFEESLQVDQRAKSAPLTGVPSAFLTGQDQLQSESRIQNSKDHLEYFAWRHLEHILSVCAIPTRTPGLLGEEAHSSSGSPPELKAIALTCGDMSGHRINTTASFFAFQFLVEFACRLKKCQTKTRYMVSLENRIEATCSGHIRWLQLLQRTKRPKGSGQRESRGNKKAGKGYHRQTGCFAANYWVTGEMMPENSDIRLPLDTTTDTALHILKIAEFVKIYPEGDTRAVADQVRDDVYIPWLVELDKLDKRNTFAWPHARVEGINTFRLDDHFWIWKALKFLDGSAKKVQTSLSIRDEDAKKHEEDRLLLHHPWLERLFPNDRSILDNAKEFKAIAKRLAPSNVQRGILQRFTTENDVSKKRMLAVTRSARETRFLLHARDIALFYAEDCGFFPPGSFGQLWADTIETQRYHEENQEAVWDNALRYALGIMMGTRGHTLNNDTAADLVKRCVSILISIGGHDAFFPGDLEEGGREPTIFDGEDTRDFFYYAGFEINYVLLSNARRIDELFRGVDATRHGNLAQANPAVQSSNTDEKTRRLIQLTLAELLGGLSEQRVDRVMRTIDSSPHVFKDARNLQMKKFSPFTNVIYTSNIKPIEEEWLYNYPDFLSGSSIDINELESLIESAGSSSESTGTVISKMVSALAGTKEIEYRLRSKESSSESTETAAINKISARADTWRVAALLASKGGNSLSFHVADFKKQKGLGRRQKRQLEPDTMVQVHSNEELFKRLGACRTAVSAKKRFIWLPNADAGTALACWGASPERERHGIALFFDRHARYEMNVWDDTSIVFNEWQTELHLSFYVLVDEEYAWCNDGLLNDADKPFPSHAGKVPTGKRFQRASISFRFDGDFFDRYWTCHFIEHVPGARSKEKKKWDFPFQPHMERNTGVEQEQPSLRRSRDKNEQKPWWQRKVLELYLLNRTLRNINLASLAILEEVRGSLGLTALGSKRHLLSMKYWQQFEDILQSIEEDLTATLFAVQKWNSREKDRGEENPRWTRNDEKKYRTTIKKLHNTTKDTADILNDRRDNIRRLKETLTASQTRLRDNLELHQNENVRYFTYATVIFLPLGFAASFYSMSGSPDYTTIVSLVVFACAAFAVTVLVLLSSRIVFKGFRKYIGPKSVEFVKAAGAVEYKVAASGIVMSVQVAIARIIAFSLELSARKVVRAVSTLQRADISPQAVLDAVLGVFFIMVLGPSWLLKLLFVNICDLFQACGINVQDLQTEFSCVVKEERRSFSADEQRRLRDILELSQTLRPFKGKTSTEHKRYDEEAMHLTIGGRTTM